MVSGPLMPPDVSVPPGAPIDPELADPAEEAFGSVSTPLPVALLPTLDDLLDFDALFLVSDGGDAGLAAEGSVVVLWVAVPCAVALPAMALMDKRSGKTSVFIMYLRLVLSAHAYAAMSMAVMHFHKEHDSLHVDVQTALD